MKRLGTVLHRVDNLLIIRADKNLDTGMLSQGLAVITKRSKKIGKVKELFGPVVSPYISATILKDIAGSELIDLKNERVYLK